MKRCFLLLMLVMVGFSAFSQNIVESKYSSAFVNFNQLGISKEAFVKEFGNPIAKDLSYDQDKNKIEVLYYIENFKKEELLIITEFAFKNNELVKQKSRIERFSIEEIIKKISNDLTFIRRWQ